MMGLAVSFGPLLSQLSIGGTVTFLSSAGRWEDTLDMGGNHITIIWYFVSYIQQKIHHCFFYDFCNNMN